MREKLRVNNSRLGDALAALEDSKRAVWTEAGWVAVQSPVSEPQPALPLG
ncbi:MAG: hypothetical protein FJ100_17520 [Deltaproteobacteria bacterium]|nr:hypothetical protein [Deltaproteobacteria bacterium]